MAQVRRARIEVDRMLSGDRVTLLLAKVVLTPLFIAAVTLAGRRWGPAVGGWLAGLPLTSGPVSVFLALEQGPGFAVRAAVGRFPSGNNYVRDDNPNRRDLERCLAQLEGGLCAAAFASGNAATMTIL